MRRRNSNYFCPAVLLIFLASSFSVMTIAFGQTPIRDWRSKAAIPNGVMLRIVRAEDERRWDADLWALLSDQNTAVRRRAALAAGRIGDESAVTALVSLLQKDSDDSVRAMAAFALGEIESATAADALLAEPDKERPEIRARIVEALGKIAAALPKSEEARARPMREAILGALEFETLRGSLSDREAILLGLTAALRARPENAGKVIARFLGHSDRRVRADAANALARLRLKDGNDELRPILTSDPDPIVRANAARALGATEDKPSFDALLDRATKDTDLRVRVSAIRALGALRDPRAGTPMLRRGEGLYLGYRARRAKRAGRPTEVNEILEIATTLGRVWAGKNDQLASTWLRKLDSTAPEVNIAFARIAPAIYLQDTMVNSSVHPSSTSSGTAKGWGELASHPNALLKAQAGLALRMGVCVPKVDGPECDRVEKMVLPDFLRAYAAFKPNDIADVLRKQLSDSDVIIRATAAELLGDLPLDETNTHALIEALSVALNDKDLNDAALAILDALAKQKRAAANDAIKTALDSTDHLIRRRAVALLRANGVGDFSDRIGTVRTRNTLADYQRAIDRIGKRVRATVTTSKGSFVIELLSEDAPLTVDNFVNLARKGFFNGQEIPRVVPNFVIQAGDPRGDTNGGPGYQIRCEINRLPYDRGAVGMALSGKDTGGSQWFVTHSPQPHLDGGYTVFGRVISGMEVVDRIARGDIIKSVSITEGAQSASKPASVKRTSQTTKKRT